MKFTITDGRPWYKQLVSGFLYGVLVVLAIPILFVALVNLYFVGWLLVITCMHHLHILLVAVIVVVATLLVGCGIGATWIWSTTKVAHETTTKKCPNCGNTMLARMPSLNTKKCTDCGKWLVWELDKGQSSPYTDMRNFD